MKTKNPAQLLAEGAASFRNHTSSHETVEYSDLALKGIEACKKTLLFPLGTNEIHCYDYTNPANEYCSWGICTISGIFSCFSNFEGFHFIGKCNLLSFESVFNALKTDELKDDLKRFLEQQINKANDINNSK